MNGPNKTAAAWRALKWCKLESIGAKSATEAETIAASKRAPDRVVKVTRFRIGPRSERWYSWQVHVYAKEVKP